MGKRVHYFRVRIECDFAELKEYGAAEGEQWVEDSLAYSAEQQGLHASITVEEVQS